MPRSLLDTIHDAAARVRYGRTQDEMFRALAAGQVPGAPPLNSADTSEAERFASSFSGARKWGRGPADLFNAIALGDVADTVRSGIGILDPDRLAAVVTRKHMGSLGADAGQAAADIEEKARRARILGLLRGERVNR